MVILGMYGYYRLASSSDSGDRLSTALPFTEIALLYLCVVINLVAMGKFTYDKWIEKTKRKSLAKA